MERANGRLPDAIRPITFETGVTKWAEGSVLVRWGDTHVLCNASLERNVPRWLHLSGTDQGWLTAEYGMLPRSTQSRMQREQRWPRGRTQEISRLIGRSLRMALDLTLLGKQQLTIDCDVLQADGGTRTAAINGGWLAVQLALRPLIAAGELPPELLTRQIAAVSVGWLADTPLLDLDYSEDSTASADLNVVMSGDGGLIEVQGTGEKAPLGRPQFDQMLTLATTGIEAIFARQTAALATFS
jgi:ribonuclease PH